MTELCPHSPDTVKLHSMMVRLSRLGKLDVPVVLMSVLHKGPRLQHWPSTRKCELVEMATEVGHLVSCRHSELVVSHSQSALVSLNSPHDVRAVRIHLLDAGKNHVMIRFLWITSHVDMTRWTY